MNRNETRERHTPFGWLPKTKEKNLTAHGRRSGWIKPLLPENLMEFPEPNGLGARWDRGGVLVVSARRGMKSKSSRQYYTMSWGNLSELRP